MEKGYVHSHILKAMASEGTWDRSGFNVFGNVERGYIARGDRPVYGFINGRPDFAVFVSDAPVNALQFTGRFIGRIFDQICENYQRYPPETDPKKIRLSIASSIDKIREYLLEEGGYYAYTTLTLALKKGEDLHVFSRGDSPLYVIGGGIRRICEDKEGSYIGYKNEENCPQEKISTISLEGASQLLLLTDGVEDQVGGRAELEALLKQNLSCEEFSECFFDKYVKNRKLVDDITLEIIDLNRDISPIKKEYLRRKAEEEREIIEKKRMIREQETRTNPPGSLDGLIRRFKHIFLRK